WTLAVDGKSEPRHIASPKSGILNVAWAPSRHIAFLAVDKPGLPGWADMELHISDGETTRRLAAERHLNIQVTSYGDALDTENNGQLRKLSDAGSRWYAPFHRSTERLSITHPDGHDIDAWLMTANDKRTKAPLVIDVHGGPNASFGPTPWLEMNALADAGFHVMWSNPRGSTSYGEDYAKTLEGRWGEPDGSDLLRIIDCAVGEGLPDRDQIGIMGHSYGGFMTN